MFQYFLALLLQLSLAALALAAPVAQEVSATTAGNSWQYGTGGGVLGFIVLVLDILVFSMSARRLLLLQLSASQLHPHASRNDPCADSAPQLRCSSRTARLCTSFSGAWSSFCSPSSAWSSTGSSRTAPSTTAAAAATRLCLSHHVEPCTVRHFVGPHYRRKTRRGLRMAGSDDPRG